MQQKTNRVPRKSLTILFVAIMLAASLVTITPSVDALTFTDAPRGLYTTNDPNSGNTLQHNTAIRASPDGNTVYYFLKHDGTLDDLIKVKIDSDGRVQESGAVSTVGDFDPVAGWDIYVETSTIFHLCFLDGGDLFYQRSNTGGGLFSGPVLVEGTTSLGSQCSITKMGSTLLVFYDDNTPADLRVKRSTDGGETWGSSIVVSEHSPHDDNSRGLAFGWVAMKKNETDLFVLTASDANEDIFGCTTTDAGATWDTCAAGDTARHTLANFQGMYGFFSSDTGSYHYVYLDEAVVWRYCVSDSTSVGTACATVGTPLALAVSPTLAISSSDPDVIFAGYTRATTTLAPWKYRTSDDGGVTWSAEQDLFTKAFLTRQDSADVHVFNNGLLAASFYDCLVDEMPTGVGPEDSQIGCNEVGRSYDSHHLKISPFSDSGFSAVATASVTDLVGFDVDATGTIAIARTGAGENVETFDAKNLGAAIASFDTRCDLSLNEKEDGVLAKNMDTGNSAQLVAFVNCDAGGDQEFLSIRQTNLDDPTASQFQDMTGETCTPGGGVTECPLDIDLTQFTVFGGNLDSVDNNLGKLGQINDFPIDYSNNDQEEFGGADRRQVAWAWSSQQCANTGDEPYCDDSEPGHVGVAVLTVRTVVSDGPDEYGGEFVQVHPSNDARDVCIGLDGTQYYLASASSSAGNTFRVNFERDTNGDGELTTDIITPGSSFGNGPTGVACGGGQILLGDTNVVELYSRTGVFLSSVVASQSENRGVAISEEFVDSATPDIDTQGTTCTTALEGTGDCVQFGAYVDGTTVRVVELTGGTIVEVAAITIPDGTWHSMIMDRTAQNLWIATDTTISRFEIINVTTVEPVSFIPGDGDGDGDGGGDGAAEALDNFFASELFGALLIILAIVLVCAIIGSKWGRTGFVMGALIGGSLGVAITAGANLLPKETTFLIVVLVGGMFFARKL